MVKKVYVIHMRILKQALNHRLVFKKMQKAIKFNTNAQLKSYTDMNTKLRKKAKNDFENNFLKLTNISGFGKSMGNMSCNNQTKKELFCIRTKLSYHTTKVFSEILLATEMKNKTHIFMNKPVYVGLSILMIFKIVMVDADGLR